jgi:hypothetical protein
MFGDSVFSLWKFKILSSLYENCDAQFNDESREYLGRSNKIVVA